MATIRALFSVTRSALFKQNHVIQAVKPKQKIYYQPMRLFASDLDMLKTFKTSQLSRISIPEPKASELIYAIIEKDYAKATVLVKQGVNVDGHNSGENTPLTDAAQRGDAKGVEFLLKNLKANPYASCDCPHHKTAMHYAAENGHINVIKVLLENGVQPNVLDSRKYTALDVTKEPKLKQLLIANGGQIGKELEKNKVLVDRYLPKR